MLPCVLANGMKLMEWFVRRDAGGWVCSSAPEKPELMMLLAEISAAS